MKPPQHVQDKSSEDEGCYTQPPDDAEESDSEVSDSEESDSEENDSEESDSAAASEEF